MVPKHSVIKGLPVFNSVVENIPELTLCEHLLAYKAVPDINHSYSYFIDFIYLFQNIKMIDNE